MEVHCFARTPRHAPATAIQTFVKFAYEGVLAGMNACISKQQPSFFARLLKAGFLKKNCAIHSRIVAIRNRRV
jgi:hypothetical protein